MLKVIEAAVFDTPLYVKLCEENIEVVIVAEVPGEVEYVNL